MGTDTSTSISTNITRRSRPLTLDRMPKGSILLTILFTSLAWVVLDLILFATHTDGPSTSGKLPVPDEPVPHPRVKREGGALKVKLAHPNVDANYLNLKGLGKKSGDHQQQWEDLNNNPNFPVADKRDLELKRKEKLLKWRKSIDRGAKADSNKQGHDNVGSLKPDLIIKRHPIPAERRQEKDHGFNEHDKDKETDEKPNLKVEEDSLVEDRIVDDKPEEKERPKSFQELHEGDDEPGDDDHESSTSTKTSAKKTTKTKRSPSTSSSVSATSMVKKLGDLNKFMRNWREESIDRLDVDRQNDRLNSVNKLMNKIDHNAKAILDNNQRDIDQNDHPWVVIGDEKRVPTQMPLEQSSPTSATTTKGKERVNKFMQNWREERFDRGDIAQQGDHRNAVDKLMNKIDHNAKAILDNHQGDIDRKDHPWVVIGDEKRVPTQMPLEQSTTSTVIPKTEPLVFSPIRDMDVTSFPRNPGGPGEGGLPVMLSQAEKAFSQQTWTKNHFSLYVSDKISLERSIRDIRPPQCRQQQFPYAHLPKTSIIICFTDEAWSTLLRSVHSVLNRSPPELVEEIILVDDFSTKEHLKQKLDDYVAKLNPKVKVLRLKKREGLIRARLAAVEIAAAPVLTFLDSHIECTVGWLEPLLERIRLNPHAVPCPVIDTINDHSFMYASADMNIRGGFSWTSLMFRWVGVPDYELKRRNSTADPIKSPTMAGGLFSIRKDYFYELGTYDPGLQIWGGENIELSFKVWMCGGVLEILPCSHVGHIFRTKQPYKFPSGDNVSTFLKNSLRVASVFLDDYMESFFAVNPALRRINPGDISERLAIRRRLKCHDFGWYLKNVYPELFVPGRKLKARGQLVNSWIKGCLDTGGGSVKPNVGVGHCHGMGGNQVFRYTESLTLENSDICIGAPSLKDIKPLECISNNFKWEHVKGGYMKDVGLDLCLEVQNDGRNLQMAPCVPNKAQQQWTFDQYF